MCLIDLLLLFYYVQSKNLHKSNLPHLIKFNNYITYDIERLDNTYSKIIQMFCTIQKILSVKLPATYINNIFTQKLKTYQLFVYYSVICLQNLFTYRYIRAAWSCAIPRGWEAGDTPSPAVHFLDVGEGKLIRGNL